MNMVFNEAAQISHFDLVDIMKTIWRRKWILMFLSLSGGLAGYLVSLNLAPRFEAQGNLVIRSDALTAPDTERAFESKAVNEAVVNTEQEILTSEGLLKRVAEQLFIPQDLLPSYSLLERVRMLADRSGWKRLNDIIPPADMSAEAVVERRTRFVGRSLTIVTTKGSSVIVVRATTRDRQLSAAIVNSVMRIYMQDRADEESKTAREIENALRERLKQTRQQIEQREASLAQLFQQKGAVENSEIPAQWQRLTLLGTELIKAEVELARKRASYSTGGLAAQEAIVNLLRTQMDVERRRRQDQSATQIAVNGQRDAVASLWRVSDTLEARLIDLAAHPMSLNARILTTASAPLQPAFPSKLIFTAAGFLLTSMAVMLHLVVGNQLRARRPVAIQFAESMHAPLLGGVPQISGSRAGRSRLLKSAIGGKSSGGLSETLYAMALELEETVKQGKLRSVTVTSAHTGEGKTTVATSISHVLASMSIRVILIDLDLRRPSTKKIFSATANVLVQRLGDEKCLEVQTDEQSGLHILTPFPKGCPDPLNYLRSLALQETLQLVHERYDLVIFDTPPVMSVPDALMVARMSDAILLVAELGRNSETISAEVHRRLAGTNKPVCGVVVTKVNAGDTLSGAYSGYESVFDTRA